MTTKTKQRRSNRSRQQQVSRIPRALNPPQMATFISHPIHIRFVSSATTTGTAITLLKIFGAFGGMNIAANSVQLFYDSLKINKVEVWGVAGAGSTVAVNWAPLGTYSRPINVSDSAVSADHTPYLSTRPPTKSIASDWISTNGNGFNPTVFTLASNVAGTLIDVYASVSMTDINTGAPNNSATTAAGTLGRVYHLPLDGAAGIWLPIGLTTIV